MAEVEAHFGDTGSIEVEVQAVAQVREHQAVQAVGPYQHPDHHQDQVVRRELCGGQRKLASEVAVHRVADELHATLQSQHLVRTGQGDTQSGQFGDGFGLRGLELAAETQIRLSEGGEAIADPLRDASIVRLVALPYNRLEEIAHLRQNEGLDHLQDLLLRFCRIFSA